MKLKDQVCSLELAKVLKGLGVKQESCFFWEFTSTTYDGETAKGIVTQDYTKLGGAYFYVSAFTVAELGEALPNSFISGKHGIEDPQEPFYCGNPFIVGTV